MRQNIFVGKELTAIQMNMEIQWNWWTENGDVADHRSRPVWGYGKGGKMDEWDVGVSVVQWIILGLPRMTPGLDLNQRADWDSHNVSPHTSLSPEPRREVRQSVDGIMELGWRVGAEGGGQGGRGVGAWGWEGGGVGQGVWGVRFSCKLPHSEQRHLTSHAD